MSALIQKVARAAHQTFSSTGEGTGFLDSLGNLRAMAAKLRAKDVSLNSDLVKGDKVADGCPATYVQIHENERMSMGIFVLRAGADIPLHDHPNMYGLMRVIHGALRLRSYSALSKDSAYSVPKEIHSKISPSQIRLLIPTRFEGENTAKADEEDTCLLTPSQSNFHQVTAVGGPAAFIDILSPPYNCDDRDCHYYEEVGTQYDDKLKHDVTWLLEIDVPSNFWCGSSTYYGPKI